jgi:hypothetical protein
MKTSTKFQFDRSNGSTVWPSCRYENAHQISMGSVKGFKIYSHLNFFTPELWQLAVFGPVFRFWRPS